MTRRYAGPSATSIEEAERVFASGTEEEICQVMVDLSFDPDVDPKYTEEQCLRLLREDNWIFWGIAAVCLGHICPRHPVDLGVALPLLEARAFDGRNDQVADGLSALRHSHRGLRAATTEKHRAGYAQTILQWEAGRIISADLWFVLRQYGGEKEFSRLSDLLDPYVEPPSEPDASEREVIRREAVRVRQEIANRPASDARFLADERLALASALEYRVEQNDLETERMLASAALTIPEAAAVLREINDGRSIGDVDTETLRLVLKLSRG